MFSLVLGIIIILAAVAVITLVKLQGPLEQYTKAKNFGASVFIAIGIILGGYSGFAYNDPGWNQHVRTAFGTETSVHDTGWYFEGWGRSTAWPDFITVSHSNDDKDKGSAINTPYRVRLADNWSGDVIQNTRFGIPKDSAQFLSMANTFRSPERLVSTTLKPAVTASLDSVANMFTMEEYYAGGKRDQFKSEYEDAIKKGRAKVRQVVDRSASGVSNQRNAANDSDVAKDTSEIGDTSVQRFKMEKILDANGDAIRQTHDYKQYGIVVASAILENLDPDTKFEAQIQARKEAASRRIVAREQRMEQEEQRLLAIQTGQTDIAKRQATAQVEQIQKTTEAETSKQLALIKAELLREEASIAKETAAINLDKARIDAEARQVSADAQAYEKRVILEADGALQQKLDAWVMSQRVWADAAAKINVPSTVMGGGDSASALNTVDSFMSMMTVKAAKDLQVDMQIKK